MTTEKPDPAALRSRIATVLNSQEYALALFGDKITMLCAALQPQGPMVSDKAESPTEISDKPDTTADDAAVLDEHDDALAEYQCSAASDDEAHQRYRKARAAVLARMSGPQWRDIAELLDALRDIARMPEGDEDSAQKIARATLARFSAAPTEVK